MVALTYKKITGKEYEQEIIDLFNQVFSRHTTIEKWEYKHFKNPICDSGVFAAFDGGLLVGMNVFSPCKYTDGKNEYRVVQSCESAVNPSYRRLGIWNNILDIAEEYYSKQGYDYMIGFPNPQNSFHGFIKRGWNSENEFFRFIRIINPVNSFKHFFTDVSKEKIIKDLAHSNDEIFEISKSMVDSSIGGMVPVMNQDFYKWKYAKFGHRAYHIYEDKRCLGIVFVKVEIKYKHVFAVIEGSVPICKGIKNEELTDLFIKKNKSLFDVCIVWKNREQMASRKLGEIRYKTSFMPFIVKKIGTLGENIRWNPMFIEYDGSIEID
ncbi:GNAT family N-acetyltransferase [Butyrivibrio sp. M55]|uniref:GNAT family N-acetyltransferase n=1 Tax=Butyrivibrio sp. M55 TaxID=1855323 RepID=UPI0008F22074|nr:GNAT family N-acetyltransferase [Butyrivibrio sp. M55]SFU54645.1 Acetyltransferase (GNAT) domain-containing protein [Butyrivibrio sp. M55]